MFASYNPSSKPTAPITSRRKVFDNAMVAHVWAQQTQSEGRSANGNFYFESSVIYSYGSHFPIARFIALEVANFDGKQIVLYNGESRSVSTGQHQRYTLAALDGLNVRIFNVPSVAPRWGSEPDHVANVAHLVKTFEANAVRLAKAHVQNWRTDRDHDTYTDLAPDMAQANRIDALNIESLELIAYCATFGMPVPELGFKDKADKIRASFARRFDPKQIAKREAANKSKGLRVWRVYSQVAAFLEDVTDKKPNMHFVSYHDKSIMATELGYGSVHSLERKIETDASFNANARKPPRKKEVTAEQWQDGKGDSNAFAYGFYHLETMVRRVGDKLETSRGAECPFSHAVIAFRKAQECRSTGTSWHKNGQQIRVGVFSVDSIDEQGNIRAGCHTLAYDEMLRLAIREVPHLVKASFGLPVVLGA